VKRFRAAVIGLGFIGAGDEISGQAIGQSVSNLDGTHADAMAKNPFINLVAGSSRDEGRRKRFCERFPDAKTYMDWKELLLCERPDIVSIATNTPYHAEIGVACAYAGVKAIMCEKPIATRLSDADKLLDACRKNNTILAINHSRRWHPLWQKCKNELKSGIIGEIYGAYIQWPTGRIGNIGTHMFDALRMLLGKEVNSVSGRLDPLLYPDCRGPQYKDPGGWGMIEFSTGAIGFFNAGQSAKFPLLMRITGSDGEMTIFKDRATVNNWRGDKKEIFCTPDGKTSLDRAMEDIVGCLLHERIPACTGEDGLMALEVIIGCHISDKKSGKWIDLPLSGKDRDLEVLIG